VECKKVDILSVDAQRLSALTANATFQLVAELVVVEAGDADEE
jgi:hypothetical protein